MGARSAVGVLLVACASAPSAPPAAPWHPVYLVAREVQPFACPAGVAPNGSCFVRVPGARFRMGAQATDPAGPGYDPAARPDEGPVHDVEVASFWMQAHEVSAEDYGRCLAAGACQPGHVLDGPASNRGREDARWHPINGVSWDGAVAYCGWMGARLPTEAEWELAARGTDGRRWPWGNEPGCGSSLVAAAVARHDEAGASDGPPRCLHRGTTHAADHGAPSPYGLHFLAGNVWEWVADGYAPYPAGPVRDPKGPATAEARVQRGGGWTNEDPLELRATARGAVPPDQRFDDVGFRCAISDEGRLMPSPAPAP